MSLNGLDTAAVNEAYQTAIGESAGWFLLRYVSRDEVDILHKGSGGVAEVREAIDTYEEKSPLFGLIHFRRKNVLLKYLPEGTSRLLQGKQEPSPSAPWLTQAARLAVHLQAIVAKFAHDTIISFAGIAELTEPNLSSAISLLKTANSVKSSHAPTRRPLTEIVEDAGEAQAISTLATEAHELEAASPPTPHSNGGEVHPISNHLDSTVPPSREKSKHAIPHIQEIQLRPEKKEESSESERPAVPVHGSTTDESSSTRRQLQEAEFERKLSLDRRFSSQSARPSAHEINVYGGKPKVKLGPRPSVDHNRQKSRGSLDLPSDARPVASLPKGVLLTSRKMAPARPQTQAGYGSPRFVDDGAFSSARAASSSSSPAAQPDRPTSRAGSVASVPSYLHSTEPKSPSITPEKLRLMKAMQLRKRRMDSKMEPLHDDPPESPTPVPTTTIIISSDPSTAHLERSEALVTPEETVETTQPRVERTTITIPELSEGPSTLSSHNSPRTPILQLSAAGVPNHGSEGTAVETSDEHPEALISTAGTESHPAETQDQEISTATLISGIAELEGTNDDAAAGDMLARQTAKNGRSTTSTVRLLNQVEGELANVFPSEAEATTETTAKSATETTSKHPGPLHAIPVIDEGNAAEQSTHLMEPQDAALDTAEPRSRGLDSLLPVSGAQDQQHRMPMTLATPTEATSDHPPSEHLQAAATTPETRRSLSSDKTSADASVEEDHTSKRRGRPIEPIKIRAADASDDNISLNESLMDELHSATLQEARPVIVSKSPGTPVFPSDVITLETRKSTDALRLVRPQTSPGEARFRREETPPPPPERAHSISRLQESPATVRSYRAISNESRKTSNGPATQPNQPFPPFQASHQFSTNVSASNAAPVSKKGGVSSLISQRIKALEKVSASSPPQAANPAYGLTPPSLVSSRKNSLTNPASTPTPPHEKSYAGRRWGSKADASYPSPTPSPQPQGNLISRALGFKKSDPSHKAIAQSVSVTARIVRDGTHQNLKVIQSTSDPTTLTLRHSALEVHHTHTNGSAHAPPSTRPSPSIQESSRSSISSKSRGHDLVSASNDKPEKAERPSRRTSISSRKTSVDTVRPPSLASSDLGSVEGNKEEKKESKKRRLLKRMSAMAFSPRRANKSTPSLHEEPILERNEPDTQKGDQRATDLGELNVQFPDTLLWKRRHITIDHQGYLTLTPAKSEMNARVGAKRYHLSEFRSPYIPDQDRQELPNSVILDFKDSSSLQCACENATTQSKVLHALFDAFRSVV